MKKHSTVLLFFMCAVLGLSACGGAGQAGSAAPAATTAAVTEAGTADAKETEGKEMEPKETEAPEEAADPASAEPLDAEPADAGDEAAAEDEAFDSGDEAEEEMTPEGFRQYFDMLLSDSGISPDDYYVEYSGRKNWYDELGELYEAAKEAGGTIDVSLMGEEEEMLDLEIMAGYLSFMNSWNDWDTDSIDQELIDRFHGDWHGVVQFRDCTGKYKDTLGADPDWVTAIAWFIIDSDGYVVPFLGLHVEDTPIEELAANLDQEDGCMYLSGSWISVPFEDVPMTEKDGTLHCEIPISKEAGSFTMVFNLRHLNDTGWTDESPALPEDYIVNCQGWSFDQLAESNGYTSWDYASYNAGEEPEYPVQIAREEEKEDFGKTTADADGIVSIDQLKAAYAWLNAELDRPGHDPITYEAIREQLGADGKKQSPAQWTAERHKYEWTVSDGKEWMDIFFNVNADGSETFAQVSPSSGLG